LTVKCFTASLWLEECSSEDLLKHKMSSLWFLYGFTWVAQLSREQGGDVILIDCLIFCVCANVSAIM